MKRILTDNDIKEMKFLYKNKLASQLELSKKYNVSVMTISLWLRDNAWEIVKQKTRERSSWRKFIGRKRCEICTAIIDDEFGNIRECNCRKDRPYYSQVNNDAEDIAQILQDERKSFYI